ncbi:WhiB family transcriptional regulator, redox-sensing transcriptional regulator [Amycolatopsis marina]|uniref:Transcriptional regulator WhiB n=2 Tax=Amycolatopsis marina TaxID=490629 RepID=A0A1I1CUU3_9PSEU|nr:WhiB family transcriptional regulator, redox-sensing transcriptional regulator [Amycolatopsis marina]
MRLEADSQRVSESVTVPGRGGLSSVPAGGTESPRLQTDGKEWGHVMDWAERPEQELGVLTDLFDEPEEQEWQDRALCAQTDPEAFFPEKGGSTREAKRICQGCEVKDDCLEYALAHDERFGIWGGLSERERRKLKKRAV